MKEMVWRPITITPESNGQQGQIGNLVYKAGVIT